MNNVASVKDRLKNKADSSGKTMMELLTAYGLERTVYRLSVSRFANNCTLKGAIFLSLFVKGWLLFAIIAAFWGVSLSAFSSLFQY